MVLSIESLKQTQEGYALSLGYGQITKRRKNGRKKI